MKKILNLMQSIFTTLFIAILYVFYIPIATFRAITDVDSLCDFYQTIFNWILKFRAVIFSKINKENDGK